MAMTLSDLCPTEATFTLSGMKGHVFTLDRFSLFSQKWLAEKYGDKVKEIFENRHLFELAEVVYFQLKEKNVFPTVDDLLKQIVTHEDRAAIITALLETVGISKPKIKELAKEMDEDLKKKALLTGAKSMTSSRRSTATK